MYEVEKPCENQGVIVDTSSISEDEGFLESFF